MGRKQRLKKKHVKYDVSKVFDSIIQDFQKIFYYGSEVDRWLPEIMLYPYVSLEWKNIPTWYRIIAPPSSGKTAHLLLIADFYLSYSIDEFTPKSFISGFKGTGEDVSTLPQVNGKVLVVLDESTMLEQRQEDRNQVQAILRKAYDGRVSKSFGNVKGKVEHKAYFNILAAATPQIDRYFLYNQALGERYINFRLQIPNRHLLTKRAFNNQMGDAKQKCEKLKTRLYRFMQRLPIRDLSEIKIDTKTQEMIIACADFVAHIRTHVPRDLAGRHITILPQPEAAGRLVQQMVQVAAAGAIIHGSSHVKQEQLSKAIYVALCSMPAVLTFMLYSLWKYTEKSDTKWFSIQKITLYTAIGRVTVSRILEDLAIHRIIKLRKQGKVRGFEYCLSDRTKEVIKDVNLFEYYVPPIVNVLNEKRLDRDRTNTPPVKRKKKKITKKKGIKNGH